MRKKLLFFLPLLFIYSSCCSNVSNQNSGGEIDKQGINNQQTVQPNKSIVKIKILETGNSDGFKLLGTVLTVQEDPFYPSIAVSGAQYNFTLGLVLTESKEVDDSNEKNKRLLQITGLSIGDEFNAVISFDKENGWIINDYIGDE